MGTFNAWIRTLIKGTHQVAEKQGNELASISIYLNTPIVAILLGLGFIVGSVLFAGVMLVASWESHSRQLDVSKIFKSVLLQPF